jgi:hypothetical protein
MARLRGNCGISPCRTNRLVYLETRLALATWQVANTLVDGSPGSLRYGITHANA